MGFLEADTPPYAHDPTSGPMSGYFNALPLIIDAGIPTATFSRDALAWRQDALILYSSQEPAVSLVSKGTVPGWVQSLPISEFSGENPGLGRNRAKVATSVTARAAHHHLAQTRPLVTLESTGPSSLSAIYWSFESQKLTLL